MKAPSFKGLRRLLTGPEPNTEPAILDHRRVFIMPTRMGALMFGVLLVMVLGGINYENNLIFATAFLLAATTVVSMLHTYRNLVGLGVTALRSGPVFAGEKGRFTVLLDNSGERARHAVSVSAAKGQARDRTDVAPGEPAEAVLPVPTSARGRLGLGRIEVATTFPLGLFRAWSVLHPPAECLVYPVPEAEGSGLPQERADDRDIDQQQPGGAGVEEFHGIRDYQSGDSYRRVHWKAVSRGLGMQTKEFSGTAAQTLWLDFSELAPLDSEARLSRLTRQILTAHSRRSPYGLRLPGVTIPPDHGLSHKHRCLAALALWGEGSAHPTG
ncbi:MAG: DUF58 domain-containing protein [Desulfohalobiaceae bacterium]